MSERVSGMAFHVHHNILVEHCYDCNERIDFIKKHKPSDEQELRLKLFKMLPESKLPERVAKAWAEYDKARAENDKAWAEYHKTMAEYGKAILDNCAYLEQLHKELCPDCPWDGYTIFQKKEVKNGNQA